MAGDTNAVDLPTTGGSYRSARSGCVRGENRSYWAGTSIQYILGRAVRRERALREYDFGEWHRRRRERQCDRGRRDTRSSVANSDRCRAAEVLGSVWTPLTVSSAKPDAFIAKLNPSGSAIAWATYHGRADSSESFDSVTIAASGDLLLSGEGASSRSPEMASASCMRVKFAIGWGRVTDLGANGLVYASGLIRTRVRVPSRGKLSARILGLANAASQQITGEIAPGEIVSLYGLGIGPAQEATLTLDTTAASRHRSPAFR
jgi:hypothetical protein